MWLRLGLLCTRSNAGRGNAVARDASRRAMVVVLVLVCVCGEVGACGQNKRVDSICMSGQCVQSTCANTTRA